VAQAIHAVSARANHPFISVNMGGLPEASLRASSSPRPRRVHGRQRRPGRPLRARRGGSLFMDEIGNIPAAQQAKILRPSSAGSSSGWDPRARSARTCGSSRPPTPTSRRRSPRAGSARTCSSGSTRSRSRCRAQGAPGGHRSPGPAFPAAARRALPQGDHGLRRRGGPRDARLRLARQRPRAQPRGRARGPDGAGPVIRAAELALNASAAAPRLDDMSLEEVEPSSSRRRSPAATGTPEGGGAAGPEPQRLLPRWKNTGCRFSREGPRSRHAKRSRKSPTSRRS